MFLRAAQVYVKLLVSNAASGSIIGKVRSEIAQDMVWPVPPSRTHLPAKPMCPACIATAMLVARVVAAAPRARFGPHEYCLQGGGNINDVQAKTFARIQLSKANEYFPGTTERTLLVTGRLKQVGQRGRWQFVVHCSSGG